MADKSKAGVVRALLFANYVTQNQSLRTLSLIDMLESIAVPVFPFDLRIFAIAFLDGASGGCAFGLEIIDAAKGTRWETEPFPVPSGIGPRINVALPTPMMQFGEPTELQILLTVDREPFHREVFSIQRPI